MEKRIESFIKNELPEQKKIDELKARLGRLTLSSKPHNEALESVVKLEITRLCEAVLNPDEKSRNRAVAHLTTSIETILTALEK